MNFLNWYYDLKTVHKMMVLSFLTTVSLIIVGFTGYHFANLNAGYVKDIYKDRAMPMYWLTKMKEDMNGISLSIWADMLTTSKTRNDKLHEDINEHIADFDKMFSMYQQTKHDDYEIQNLNKLKEVLPVYKEARDRVIELATSNRNAEASALFIKQEQQIAEIETLLSNLVSYNEKVAKNLSVQAAGSVNTGNIIMTIIVVIATIICGWLGVHTGERIFGILDELGNKFKSMTAGDLTIKKMGRPDNSCIGDLCVTFDSMLDNLRNLISQVARSVEDIAASSEEMSASSEQTAQGAQQTAVSTSQLAQGAQNISTNIEHGANNINSMNKVIQGISVEANVVSNLGNETEKNANTGSQHVVKAVSKIDSIKQVVGDISVTIAELGQLSAEIEQIVDLIKNIAGQTNLLALNAAIEAARAGEHGKGFAVVADEVKKLAGQSAESTEKITGMIKEIQNKTGVAVTKMDKASQEVSEGVNVINDAGKALENVINQVKLANLKIQGITSEIEKVAVSSEDVVKVVENIAAVTEETAASAEEISSITEEQTASLQEISSSSQTLASIAETLNKQVSAFKV